ncbi:HpcH/HpaI aldolase/citrate lyase family protein [Streptomyces californicus]
MHPDPAARGGAALATRTNEASATGAWAERTLLRAEALGVAKAKDVGFVDLLAAGLTNASARR